MVHLSIVSAVLIGASAVAAHSGVLADGGPEHLRMLQKRSTTKCSGTRKSRTAYKQRHASSSSGGAASAAASSPKVQVAAAVKPSSESAPSKTSSSKKSEQTYVANTSSSGKGLFGWKSDQCGDSGAVETPTNDSGPNGSQNWLNCGVSSGGWNPPNFKLSDLKVISLDSAVAMKDSVYSACAPFLGHFDSIGGELGIPPILLAAIAMQESSCNPSVKGDNGGAFGLMQITQDKCSNAPNGDCNDVDYNIRTGAQYLKSEIDAKGGNILAALGQYNGWYPGLTDAGARAIRNQCWDCQQNLDYFQQLLNGWLQGLPGWKMGNVKNLAH